VIIKGKSRGKGGALGDYLLNEGRFSHKKDENERVEIWEALGHEYGATLQDILENFEASALHSQCEKPLYHIQMRADEGEHLTREQWRYAVERLEKKLGLEGHERAIVAHTKDGQEHLHVVYNRMDYETGLAKDLGMDVRKRHECARELEKELGLRQLRQNVREGKLNEQEQQQARRVGKDPQLQKEIIQTCWKHAENGKELQAKLNAHGMMLAKGETRGFLAVGREGDFYLVGRVVGKREKEVREKVGDLDREALPTVKEAQAAQARLRAAAVIVGRQPEGERERPRDR